MPLACLGECFQRGLTGEVWPTLTVDGNIPPGGVLNWVKRRKWPSVIVAFSASWLWTQRDPPPHSSVTVPSPPWLTILFLNLWVKISCSCFKLILSGVFLFSFQSNTKITTTSCLNKPLWGYLSLNQANLMRSLLRTVSVSSYCSVPCPPTLRRNSQFFKSPVSHYVRERVLSWASGVLSKAKHIFKFGSIFIPPSHCLSFIFSKWVKHTRKTFLNFLAIWQFAFGNLSHLQFGIWYRWMYCCLSRHQG